MVQFIETNRWFKWTDNDQHKSCKTIIWLNNLLHSILTFFLLHFFLLRLFIHFPFTSTRAIDNLQLLQGDGTFETVSQMIFTATRFENSAMIQCEADNSVMRKELDKPLHESLNLEVMCKKTESKCFCLLFFSSFFVHSAKWKKKKMYWEAWGN